MVSKTIIVGGLILALLAIGALFGTGILAIGDAVDSKTMLVHVYYAGGGATSKDLSYKTYGDCSADLPGAKFVKANVVVKADGTPGSSVPKTGEGNSYYFPKDVWLTNTPFQFTTSRPLQDPTCGPEILSLAKKANIGVNEIVYVTNEKNVTTIDKIYVNQTIYVCAESGKFVPKASDCTTPVPVATVKSFWAKALDWFKHFFGGQP